MCVCVCKGGGECNVHVCMSAVDVQRHAAAVNLCMRDVSHARHVCAHVLTIYAFVCTATCTQSCCITCTCICVARDMVHRFLPPRTMDRSTTCIQSVRTCVCVCVCVCVCGCRCTCSMQHAAYAYDMHPICDPGIVHHRTYIVHVM